MVDWRWRAERGVPFNPAPLLDATPMLTRGSGMLGEKHPRGVQVTQRDGPIINWKCKGFEPTRTGSWVKQPTSSSVLFTRTTPFIWISRRLSSHHGRGNEQHQTFEMMCLRGKLESQQGLSENPYRSKAFIGMTRRRSLYCVDGRKNEVRPTMLPRSSTKLQVKTSLTLRSTYKNLILREEKR